MNNMKASITDTIHSIEQTTLLFYQQKNQEGYLILNNTLNQLIVTLNAILNDSSSTVSALVNQNKLNSLLENAMKALEQKDTILLSDILIFEINDLLKQILLEID